MRNNFKFKVNKENYLLGRIIIIILSLVLIGLIIYLGTNYIRDIKYTGERILENSDTKNEVLVKDKFPTTPYVNYEEGTGIIEYGSPTMTITIEPVVKTNPNLQMWISTIKVKSADQINSAFAGDEFSLNIKERTSDIAKRHEAIFAVNGSNKSSYVIRDGIIYRDSGLDFAPLIIKENGDFVIYDYEELKGEAMLKLGAKHTYDFGPDLIKDGKMTRWATHEEFYKDNRAPRTAIGQLDTLEYVVIVADGRSNESVGMTFNELALEFQRLGCKWAYNLDGGGSTTLYFNGEVLNNPSDWNGERKISDILYFSN